MAQRQWLRKSSLEACGFAILVGSAGWAQVTQRVSFDSSGAQSNADCWIPAVSADGRYVAFSSWANNLVPGDTNAHLDVFVRDRLSGTTERVSVDSSGVQGNGDSGFFMVPGVPQNLSISADGRYVAFFSYATNLVPGDTNARLDVFVRDRQTGTTERVSVDSNGVQGNGDSGLYKIVLSSDGRYVAFDSAATNFVPSGTIVSTELFVHDRLTGTTEPLIVNAGSSSGDGSNGLSMSADGRYVAFPSSNPNLVPGDTNGAQDIFVRDRQNGTTERVNVDSAGVQANAGGSFPSISGDGRYVAFSSLATNLVAGDTNASSDIFIHDRQTGATSRVSVDSLGVQGNSGSYWPHLSADGRCVAFVGDATNLVPGDTNGFLDVFVHDNESGTTEMVSVDSGGVHANGNSGLANISISSDGRYVAFDSGASNLVSGDTNNQVDCIVHDRHATGFTSLCSPGIGGVIACPCGNPPSGPGRGCNNSSLTGGAILSATGAAYLSMDSLMFTASLEKPNALSVFSQGSAGSTPGVVFGQGVRCANLNLKRLYTKSAVGGMTSAPTGGDPAVHVRSAALGDTIAPGTSRYYYFYYRDPTVLGGCPAASSFNSTQTAQIDWSM